MDKEKQIMPVILSQKCRYALRAIFELAWRNSPEPVKIGAIAEVQDIPARFLEVIFSQLRQAGIVESRRGSEGGYVLARTSKEITVGEIIRVFYAVSKKSRMSPFYLRGDYAFTKLDENITIAVSSIYDNMTFTDLVDEEMNKKEDYVSNYTI